MQAVFRVKAPNGASIDVMVNEWSAWNPQKRKYIQIMISDLFTEKANNAFVKGARTKTGIRVKDDKATEMLRARNDKILAQIKKFPGFWTFL